MPITATLATLPTPATLLPILADLESHAAQACRALHPLESSAEPEMVHVLSFIALLRDQLTRADVPHRLSLNILADAAEDTAILMDALFDLDILPRDPADLDQEPRSILHNHTHRTHLRNLAASLVRFHDLIHSMGGLHQDAVFLSPLPTPATTPPARAPRPIPGHRAFRRRAAATPVHA